MELGFKTLKSLLVVLIFINAISCANKYVGSCPNETVKTYINCIECSIKDQKFIPIQSYSCYLTHAAYIGDVLTYAEKNNLASRAAFHYEYYLKPFLDYTTNPVFDDVRDYSKVDFVKMQLAASRKNKKSKLKAWRKSLPELPKIKKVEKPDEELEEDKN